MVTPDLQQAQRTVGRQLCVAKCVERAVRDGCISPSGLRMKSDCQTYTRLSSGHYNRVESWNPHVADVATWYSILRL